MTLRLVLPVPPSLNRYYRTFRGRILLSADGRAYKTLAAGLAWKQGARPLAGPLTVRLWVFRARKRGDADNFLKACLDSLGKGVCYEDDSQIRELHLWLGDDKAYPRVEVEVSPVPDQPNTP